MTVNLEQAIDYYKNKTIENIENIEKDNFILLSPHYLYILKQIRKPKSCIPLR